MNQITRMLAMTGLGVFAAVSVGAGPAMAATGGTQTPAKPASPEAKAKPGASAQTRIIDIYPSRGSCSFAGLLGERRGNWDDYVCYRTGGGYALTVSFDSWSDWNNWSDNDWSGPWGFHGNGGGFHGNGGGFHGNGGGFHGNGGGFHGHGGGFHGHGNNGVGAIPGTPGQIPPLGAHSPS